ncbi:MAG: sigma-70 family RNA polymerase sigma factor [Polyangiaceae bacterium]|nr:sigma-70 family RNA polymerase sigma factor [Polyangiaceae bacterium]
MLCTDATATLVVRAQRGEAAAFEALARAYLRAAYSVALGFVGRPADAEDVAQDALVQAFEHLDSCREPARFAGWLLQIVRNRARNGLASRKLRDVPAAEAPSDPPADGAPPDAGALRRELCAALGRLGAVPREVVLLHDLEGWTHAEIAAGLDISEVMSRQHLFVARRALRRALDGPSAGGEDE